MSFIKSTHCKPQYDVDPEAIAKKRGYLLEHQCFLYYWRHANANRTVNYRCIEGKTNKKCSASCVVNEKGDHIRSTPHNHPSYTQLEIEIRSFATKVKERTFSEDITPSAIYTNERSKLIQRTQSESQYSPYLYQR